MDKDSRRAACRRKEAIAAAQVPLREKHASPKRATKLYEAKAVSADGDHRFAENEKPG